MSKLLKKLNYLSNMQTIYHLFVYGSLRSGFKSDAYGYISKHFKLLGNAKVNGLLYDLGTHPVAKPTTQEDKFIVGELYCINHMDEFGYAIAQLDDYEGVFVEEGEQQLYYRELTNTVLEDGTTQQAWVYWYKGSVMDKPIVESGDVLIYLQQKNARL